MRLNIVRRTVMATALAVATAVAAVAGQAQAFTFGSGDLVLAIYGNSQEALYNLGAASTLLGLADKPVDVLAGLTTASIGDVTKVQYTMFGFDNTGTTYAGTTSLPSAISSSAVALTQQFEAMFGMQSLGGFTGDTIAATDGLSFTSNLNSDGASNFIGTWPVTMSGTLGSLINVIQGNATTNAFAQAGSTHTFQMFLDSTGVLHVGNNLAPAPVPLPGVVVLFGTGLIGLIGIARRKLNRMEA